MTEVWPPPGVKELCYAKDSKLSPNALWPSPKEIDEEIRVVGRQLLLAANSDSLKDRYPMAVVSSRGGLEVANKLLRPFGYGNPNIRYYGITSYDKETGTERTKEFLQGHIPLAEDIEGQDLILVDECVDSGHSQVEMRKGLVEGLGAASVASVVLDYKEEASQAEKGAKFVPEYFAAIKPAVWIVYPWDIYEIAGPEIFDESVWVQRSDSA